MKSRFLSHSLIAACLAILSLGFHAKTWAGVDAFERIFFFGDSLSDAGNIFAITGETAQPPYDIIPSRPYDIDGYQFSNGKTWAQWFARHLELKRSGQAALFAQGTNGNYAYGGARARNSEGAAPSSHAQLALFLQDYHDRIDPAALYVIQFGGNDIRDAIEKFFQVIGSNPHDPTIFNEASQQAGLIIQAAVTANIELIEKLYNNGNGANHFLVVNAPNLALTPAIQGLGSQPAFIANMISGSYNDGLAAGVSTVTSLPGISINHLDLFSLINSIVEDPRSFGINNAQLPCLIFSPAADGSPKAYSYCSKPNKYLFWDGIHPTAKIHKIVSEAAESIYQ
ncbi:MAG: SGNH/GDSL hydrolase family protein [Gammaproteobacteria bacterium]|jgi:phospholipase/lecithinase/hemolysin|nr:SGNH/GDSL hydrolase family protein [Gammaproteobacteria bacterium]HUV22092.1 SGNH/GDSL hydrolase family protein [Gammaproteobacteria bacterium]